MGSNTLTTYNPNDVISEDTVNQYKTALNENVVPRNSSGVATDVRGGLGTSVYRWATSYFQKLFIGTASNNNTIEESGTNIVVSSGTGVDIKINSTTKCSINSNGIDRQYLSEHEISTGSMPSSFAITGITYVDVTGLSATITTTGKPVIVNFQPPSTTGGEMYCRVKSLTRDTIFGDIRILRNSTQITAFRAGIKASGITDVEYYFTPFTFIDDNNGSGLAAGTYTYKIQFRNHYTTNSEFELNNAELKVIEL